MYIKSFKKVSTKITFFPKIQKRLIEQKSQIRQKKNL